MSANDHGRQAFLDELRSALDERTLSVGEAVPERNRTDWSGLAPVLPLALVRPANTADVSRAMAICHRHGVPVVPQGGLTGLCGGAIPEEGAVALSLERMNAIEELDVTGSAMVVQAGVPLEKVQQAAAAEGLYMPLDLGARGSCAIGGNISTNAGGNRVIRYGMTRDMVLGLEVVLADGTVVTSLNRMIKNNAGYDLKQLFIGSEGTLGIVTRAVLRLAPLPAFSTAAVCALDSYEAVLDLLKQARRGLGPMLSAFEVMWADYWSLIATTPGLRMPLPAGHGFYVLIEAQGTDDTHDRAKFDAFLEARAESGLLADAVVARSQADVTDFWTVRDAVSEFSQTFGAHIPFDIGLPIHRMDDFAVACRAALAEALDDAHALFYGHIGDGNVHIVVRDRAAGGNQPKRLISDTVYKLVGTFGGTISAEHGIGVSKKPWLGQTRSVTEIETMARIKAALDPLGLLNPGKVL
ncbi:FAD-binding oxidoreductase [Zhengella mangrovi]|uniref:FAD-binding oxidoreductase n=1 Tax=Zhengella mangrovi TaxID=1982044 RepID=UPI00197C7924|nr:FAD-binding oxidoreductase [Zhengella mangrovi]